MSDRGTLDVPLRPSPRDGGYRGVVGMVEGSAVVDVDGVIEDGTSEPETPVTDMVTHLRTGEKGRRPEGRPPGRTLRIRQ